MTKKSSTEEMIEVLQGVEKALNSLDEVRASYIGAHYARRHVNTEYKKLKAFQERLISDWNGELEFEEQFIFSCKKNSSQICELFTVNSSLICDSCLTLESREISRGSSDSREYDYCDNETPIN